MEEIKKTFENLNLIFPLDEYYNFIENEITLRKGYEKSIYTSIKKIINLLFSLIKHKNTMN